jgi:hypothetical protein
VLAECVRAVVGFVRGYFAVRRREVITCDLGRASMSSVQLAGGSGEAHDARRPRRGGYRGGACGSETRTEREFGSAVEIGTNRGS